MAHSVKGPTLDFGSAHGLGVVRSSPTLGSVLSLESAADSLSSSPSALTPPLKKGRRNRWDLCYFLVGFRDQIKG